MHSSGPFAATVELLLESGAGADAADSREGWTALMFASGEGHAEVVKFLLSRGVDPAPRDRWGGTPRDDAVREGRSEVLAILE